MSHNRLQAVLYIDSRVKGESFTHEDLCAALGLAVEKGSYSFMQDDFEMGGPPRTITTATTTTIGVENISSHDSEVVRSRRNIMVASGGVGNVDDILGGDFEVVDKEDIPQAEDGAMA